MEQNNPRRFDLEERTLNFAKNIIDLVNNLPKNSINLTHSNQLLRSSGSIGANYIEANESLGKKDFYMRIRISRKEAKETKYWLQLILYNNQSLFQRINPLVAETEELVKFSQQ